MDERDHKIILRVAWGLSIAFTAIILLALMGCASQTYIASSSVNEYWYRYTHYERACGPEAPEPKPLVACRAQKAILDRWKSDLGLADAAIKRGGSAKYQIKDLRVDAKGITRDP